MVGTVTLSPPRAHIPVSRCSLHRHEGLVFDKEVVDDGAMNDAMM